MDNNYYNFIRHELLEYIPKNTNKLLEIGAASGNTLIEIKKNGLAEEVYGLDIVKIPNSNQQNNLIKNFIIGDIETIKLDFPENYFDVILAGDIFEHLKDPWSVLKKMTKFLKPGGLIISSIPNIRNYRVLFQIAFNGTFNYQDAGILDKTHLRFFCKKNIIHFFDKSNYKITKIDSNLKNLKFKLRLKNIINYMTFGLLKDFMIVQYFIVAKKND